MNKFQNTAFMISHVISIVSGCTVLVGNINKSIQSDCIFFVCAGSYDLPFFLAGIPPIVGALTMFLIKFVKDDSESSIGDSTGNKAACQNGR